MLAGLAFGLKSGTDFTAGVSGVVFVTNIIYFKDIIQKHLRSTREVWYIYTGYLYLALTKRSVYVTLFLETKNESLL